MAQQPAVPQDPSPLHGETYYLVNQISGLQADLNAGSTTVGANLLQNTRSFTSLTQRWALTLAPSGNWKISNIASGLCMDSQASASPVATVQQTCAINTTSQEWLLTYGTNGYYTLQNAATGLLLDVSGSSKTAGAPLVQTAAASSPTQSQLWLLRPAFLRGVDNAILAKQEADRLVDPTAFFNDAGQTEDVLQLLKSHGVNMLRLRPTPLVVPGTSTPLYTTYTLGSSTSIPVTCNGNGCTAETDAADLALAKRAKALGMSLELTMFFDGGSSNAAPGAWAGYTSAQTSAAIYAYVKAQVEEYRAAGVMPDIVSIGNEVNTGFLGSGLASGAGGSPSGAYNSTAFTTFAIYQKQGIQAVLDAASDTTLGPALPPPLSCIHTTPAWLINSFYPEANQAGIPYDMVCESYYPIDHGPLTAAQAASCTSTKSSQPEQTNLTNGANAVGKPILMIEIGERYETGFGTNDCFYPVSRVGQRQFALDMQSTLKGLPSNLGAGITWWDATGTNVPMAGGSYANYNASGVPSDLFYWDGFTLFDDADNGKYTDNFAAVTYNSALPALTALGGKLDATLPYKLVNLANGRILETQSLSGGAGAALDTGVDSGVTSLHQQWQITSNGDGYFQIANLAGGGGTANVLDNGGSATAGSAVTDQAANSGSEQEWDVVTAGNGTYTIVNKLSGLVLAVDTSTAGTGGILQQAATGSNADWNTPAGTAQQWTIVPVHISTSGAATALLYTTPPPSSLPLGTPVGNIAAVLHDAAGETVSASSATVTLTITGPSSYSQSFTSTSSVGVATFALTTTTLPNVGAYTLTVSAPGVASATATLTVTAATLTVAANNQTRAYGAQNPTLTDTVTGFVNGDTIAVLSGSPVITTTATAASPAGSYPITIAAGTLTAANYVLVYTDATLTVTKATPVLGLIGSAPAVFLQNAVNFTATVTGAGAPGGNVSFFDGTSATALVTLPLTNGAAAFTTSSLALGPHSITAAYSGDGNFSAQASSAVAATVADFSVATGASSSSSATVAAGTTAGFGLLVSPIGATTLPAPVFLSLTGAPAGAIVTFAPAAVPAGSAAATVNLTIQVPQTARLERPSLFNKRFTTIAFALLLLPILRRPKKGRRLAILLTMAFGVVLATGVTGCGGSGKSARAPQSYSIAVTGAAGPLTHSINLTLTVQ